MIRYFRVWFMCFLGGFISLGLTDPIYKWLAANNTYFMRSFFTLRTIFTVIVMLFLLFRSMRNYSTREVFIGAVIASFYNLLCVAMIVASRSSFQLSTKFINRELILLILLPYDFFGSVYYNILYNFRLFVPDLFMYILITVSPFWFFVRKIMAPSSSVIKN